ncbi:hypothetical protein [Paenibacillus sp. JDR-2]|uniref:hypothetical protein n=1 Tax=Paenibacillus sp. (strain JDR-2) TaxID=324057 RepID=UPI000166AFFE|nr:hypothetical protein [Paenibacillus sp. JDR-2]ACS98970.1 hypothetical protein Pjdr2_0290 [Paenibacillus sp. JDR-2]
MQKKPIELIFRVNGDVTSILSSGEEIGWDSISEYSIHRILYISSVLYRFRFEELSFNPFEEDYDFSVSLRGPYSDIVPYSLKYLQANKYIFINEKGEYLLSTRELPDMSLMPNYQERSSWLEAVIYILGIYGEEKIYDFVFRDPQYQDNLQRNSIKEINIKEGNKTELTLMKMKDAFEKTLGKAALELNNKRYLDMYFEYVFSKILRGETE